MSDRTEEPDARYKDVHSGFKSQVVLFLSLGGSSVGSLARYLPVILPTRMLVAGIFFGLSLAGFIYCLLSVRNAGKRQWPRSRREWMILVPVIAMVVALLVTRVVLLAHGNNG